MGILSFQSYVYLLDVGLHAAVLIHFRCCYHLSYVTIIATRCGRGFHSRLHILSWYFEVS